MDWRIGCSGYSYREWKGIFYPQGLAQKDWFKHYCQHYNCIEINSSFYKLPSLKSLEKWHAESCDDFLFSMKAPRIITHFKQLIDCQELMAEFYALMQEGLKNKLGAVLMQFPPKFFFTEERLQLLTALHNPEVTTVVEFRHASWWQQEIINALGNNGLVFCGQSFPADLPDSVIINTDQAYYRFHGVPVLYKSSYDNNFMQKIKCDLADKEHIKRAFVFFNNTWGESALKNSIVFKKL